MQILGFKCCVASIQPYGIQLLNIFYRFIKKGLINAIRREGSKRCQDAEGKNNPDATDPLTFFESNVRGRNLLKT